MSKTKIEYNLLTDKKTGTFSVRNGFASVADAKAYAKTYAESCKGRSEREFKIQQVVTVRSTIGFYYLSEGREGLIGHTCKRELEELKMENDND